MEQKLCRICGKLKDINNFAKNDKMRDGHRNECNDCKNKLYNDKVKIRERNLEKEIKVEGDKICRICLLKKPLNEFHIKRGTPDGHRSECKECIKTYLKKWKDDPDYKEKYKEYQKKRYDENRDELLKEKKEHYKKNRDRLLAYKEEYRNKPEYKIQYKEWRSENKELLAQHQSNYRKKYPHIIAWRSVLYSTLKRLGTTKEGHTIDMLGYSAIQLKEHLSSKFLPGMTWENHGEWHIDHCKAVANFPQDADIKEVCALENLQPLWAFDNLSKNCY